MKIKSKALALSLCMVLLVVATVFATTAYLTSTDSVKNSFTVGNVRIALDEADVDEDGTPVADAARVQANEYKLIPGHSYTKDPTIQVAETSEDCWIFVKVENGLSAIEAENTPATTIAAQMAAKGWTAVEGSDNVYAYQDIVQAGTAIVVFENFTISGTADVAAYADAEINVTAYAIQADGFASASAAWTAAGASLN